MPLLLLSADWLSEFVLTVKLIVNLEQCQILPHVAALPCEMFR